MPPKSDPCLVPLKSQNHAGKIPRADEVDLGGECVVHKDAEDLRLIKRDSRDCVDRWFSLLGFRMLTVWVQRKKTILSESHT